MKLRKPGNRGYTIIEIIVVILIITILAGITFPVYIHIKEKGKQTICLSNLRQLAQACLMYAQNNNDVLPPYTNGFSQQGWEYSGEGNEGIPLSSLLHDSLMSYVSNDKIFFCPSDPYAGENIPGLGKYNSSYTYLFKRDSSLTTNGYRKSADGIVAAPGDYCIIHDSIRFIPATETSNKSVVRMIHLGSRNYVFLDGHTLIAPEK